MLEASNSYNLVNGKDFSGRTPIHLAAAAGQFHTLVELISVPHANSEAEDNEGRYMRNVLVCRRPDNVTDSQNFKLEQFQMTVESNYVIAIATLSDWLKRLAPVFQPMRSKTKTNRTMYA